MLTEVIWLWFSHWEKILNFSTSHQLEKDLDARDLSHCLFSKVIFLQPSPPPKTPGKAFTSVKDTHIGFCCHFLRNFECLNPFHNGSPFKAKNLPSREANSSL